MIKQMAAVIFTVRDLDLACEFYTQALGLKLAELDPAPERRDEFIHAKGFLQIIERAVFQRLHRALRRSVGRHDVRDA